MALRYFASALSIHATHDPTVRLASVSSPESLHCIQTRRRVLSSAAITSISRNFSLSTATAAPSPSNEFLELPNSGGVKSLDLRIGSGEVPVEGDQVAIHYYGRLAAKQGWRFDSTYDHKDETGEPIPFNFVLGSGKVISGIEVAVKSMKVVAFVESSFHHRKDIRTRRKNLYHLMQRLFTTIFNPTRLANGEGSTLGTLIFDIELVSLRHE